MALPAKKRRGLSSPSGEADIRPRCFALQSKATGGWALPTTMPYEARTFLPQRLDRPSLLRKIRRLTGPALPTISKIEIDGRTGRFPSLVICARSSEKTFSKNRFQSQFLSISKQLKLGQSLSPFENKIPDKDRSKNEKPIG